MPSEQDFTRQGGMEREGERGKKGLHNEVEVEEGGEKGENGKTARGKKERERYACIREAQSSRAALLETASRCTSCTEGHARADADVLQCIPCANWTTSPKQAGNEQMEQAQSGQCGFQGGVVRQLLSLEEPGPLRFGGWQCRCPRM